MTTRKSTLLDEKTLSLLSTTDEELERVCRDTPQLCDSEFWRQRYLSKYDDPGFAPTVDNYRIAYWRRVDRDTEKERRNKASLREAGREQIEEVDRQILLELPIADLRDWCRTNAYSKRLCNTEFWYEKFRKDFGNLSYVPSVRYKDAYEERELSIDHFIDYAVNVESPSLIDYWMEETGRDVMGAMQVAVRLNKIEVLRYLVQMSGRRYGRCVGGTFGPYDEEYDVEDKEEWQELLVEASRIGHLEIVQYLVEQVGVEDVDDLSATSAMEEGHLSVADYLIDRV